MKVKIAICGDSGTGKTRLFRSMFSLPVSDISQYFPTIKPLMSLYSLDNDLELEIWDLPGNLELKIPEEMLTDLVGAIIVFSIIDLVTFENINIWLTRIWKLSPNTPILLVANKMDLASTSQEADDIIKRSKLLIKSINTHYEQIPCRLIFISASKSKNAFSVFSELFITLQQVKRVKQTNKQFSMLEKYTPKNLVREFLSKIISLPDLNVSGEIVNKISRLMINKPEIRKSFFWLPDEIALFVLQIINNDETWIEEKKFNYLLIYKGIEHLISNSMEITPDLLSHWSTIFTSKFLENIEIWERFISLEQVSECKILESFILNRSSMKNWDLEIYFAYQDANPSPN